MLFSVVQWAHRAPAKCFTWPEVQWPPLRCPHRYLWVKNQKKESSTKDFYQHHQRFMLHWCDKKTWVCLFIITLSSLALRLIILHITSLTYLTWNLRLSFGDDFPCWDDFTAGHHSPPEWDANRLLHCGFPVGSPENTAALTNVMNI